MRITFVLPFVHLTGGIKAPMEYGNRLHAMGHSVTFVYPRLSPYPAATSVYQRGLSARWHAFKSETRYQVSRLLSHSPVDWFDLKSTLIRVSDLAEKHVPDGDVIVAIDWPTAEYVNTYGPRKGSKFYLIQGYEIWSGPRERVDATWHLPLRKIVVSSWLKRLAEEQFGETVLGPLIHGVDLEQFYNRHKVYHRPRRVGMLYHRVAVKGVADGIRAFEVARRHFPNIQLVMYGSGPPGPDVPDYVEYHIRPTRDKLRQLYCSCDIWLCSSRMDGGPMHSQEAMACGCALVTTNVGAVLDYTIPEKTALVSPPGDPDALAHNLMRLLGDEVQLKLIAQAGYEYIRTFTWERAVRQLESFLTEA